MSETEKWLALSNKLLEATQKGSIKWARFGVSSRPFYETDFLDRRLRIIKSNNDETLLLFIDSDGAVEFAAPPTEGLEDLFNAVRRQEADIDQFLENVLTFTP